MNLLRRYLKLKERVVSSLADHCYVQLTVQGVTL